MRTMINYLANLERNTADVLQVLSSCPEALLTQKPDNAWSILEIAEHLLVTDRVVYGFLITPAEQQHTGPERLGNDKIKHYMIDRRDLKVVSPESLQPKGELKSRDEFFTQFSAQRALLTKVLASGQLVVDNGIIKHPLIGEMTKYDWLHFLIAHAQRHLLQIQSGLKMQSFDAKGAD